MNKSGNTGAPFPQGTNTRLLCGVIGYPLEHSLSPVLHNWAFAHTTADGAYFAWPCAPEALKDFVSAVRMLPIHGVSVTIPHKERIMPLLDDTTKQARRVGAVNTLYWQEGKLLGHNTDLEGFMHPLQGRELCSRALVLGAGGAAKAVLAGLRDLGVSDIVLAARNPDKATPAAQAFGCRLVDWNERGSIRPRGRIFWVLNTTPLGMSGNAPAASPYSPEMFRAARSASGDCLAYDLVYNPLRTRFLTDAQAAGWTTQDGLAMLLAQAEAQFRLWTGISFPPHQARRLLLAVLGRL
jgi:shikimate dehydrogenase